MTAGGAHKKRAVVLGAGPAGLSAALALIESGDYDVDVYQMGWRAGGKCATGRDEGHYRARQNGSHYLFGCYHNSFALIQQAHEILSKSTKPDKHLYGTFHGDFVARNLLVGAQGYKRLASSPGPDRGFWYRYMPQNMACPGTGGKFATPFDYFFMMGQLALGTLIDVYAAIVSNDDDDERFEGCRLFVKWLPVSPFETSGWSRFLRGVLHPVRFVFNQLCYGAFWVFKGLLVLWSLLIPIQLTRYLIKIWKLNSILLVKSMRELSRGARHAALRADTNASNGAQRLIILFELALASATGFFVDELWRAGSLERIDRWDLRDWLRRHGASHFARHSSLIRTWYDATISYEDGVEKRAKCSAGVAIQAMLRSMLTYKGAFAFQMSAEVGDSFVAPIVRALEIRGVRFHFYHRVEELEVSSSTRAVETISLNQQIPDPPRQTADLFMRVKYRSGGKLHERHCWPSVPLQKAARNQTFLPDSYYSTCKHAALKLRRRSASDCDRPAHKDEFDVVVCALPLGVIQDVLVDRERGKLADVEGHWQQMFRQVRFTESQAIRMWFNVGIEELGWRHEPPILSGTTWPHSTWEDNSQAVDVHNFPIDNRPENKPRTIATLFGPLATGSSNIRDPRHHAAQVAVARQSAEAFLGRAMSDKTALTSDTPPVSAILDLWPDLRQAEAAGPAEEASALRAEPTKQGAAIDWAKFIDLDNGVGPARFGFQVVSANVGPNESYVLAWPETLKYRARPDESGYQHLYLAGDWTRNGIEAGTVEGAVISGLKAANAITGKARPIVGADDFDRGTVLA
jgi:uncharacterized protein with NAD-binding domain and iron-sulfur cluster